MGNSTAEGESSRGATAAATTATITVVVDTNIFSSQLAQLRRLLNRSGDVGGGGTVAIYAPWAVFRELDALKSRLVWGSFSASINVMLLPSYLMPCVAFLQIVLH